MHRGDRGVIARTSLGAHVVEGFDQELVHRAEVVEDESLVAAGALGEVAGRRGREPLGAKDVDGGGDERSFGLGCSRHDRGTPPRGRVHEAPTN